MTDSTKEWNKMDTLCLIKLIGELYVPNTAENNEIFIEAANKLFEHGFSKTYLQCKSKWKELTTAYKEYKESEFGTEPPFYVELDKILSETPDSSTEMNPKFRTWTEPETQTLIKIIKNGHYVAELKNGDSNTTYERLGKELVYAGYQIRSKSDIKRRWKQLKLSYMNYIKGEVIHFKYFEQMDNLLDWQPNNIELKDEIFEENESTGFSNFDFEMETKQIRRKSNNWTHKETDTLLAVIKGFNYPKIRRAKKNDMFDNASLQLRAQGFKRSSDQCRIKFKHLKTKYFRALKKQIALNVNPEHYCQHFNKIHEIMGGDEDQNKEDAEENETEHYEVEYLEDYQNDYQLFEKVFIDDNKTNGTQGNRTVWTIKETQCLLNILKNKNIKRYSRRTLFEDVSEDLAKFGYERSANSCIIKWKNLRRQLYTSIKNDIRGNNELCPFYDELIEILQQDGSTIDLSMLNDQDMVDYESEDDHTYHRESKDLQCESDTKETGTENNILLSLLESTSKQDNKRWFENENDSSVPEPKKVKKSEKVPEKVICDYKMDDTEHYCMSLAATFKRIPHEKQAKLKIEIQKLLYQAEFEDNF